MFCPDCFKLLDDNNTCTNPACLSYVGSDENKVETNILDENRMNETALEKTTNEEIFKQPKVNTVSEDLFKQPKINTVSEELFKKPKVNTVSEELFKQPKINTVSEELFKKPKVNTVSEELFKQPKINTVSEELFKQPKVNTVSEELFKQPKINTINKELVESSKPNMLTSEIIAKTNTNHEQAAVESDDEFTKAIPIITDSMINNVQVNADSDDEFTKAIPIITDSMLKAEEANVTRIEKAVLTEDVIEDDLIYEEVNQDTSHKENKRKSNPKKENTKTSKEEREVPKLDDYFNDDLIDPDDLIDSDDGDSLSKKEMLLAFVGKKKRSYYSKHIDTYLENPNFISFNLSSLLFSLWWFWHRKMYIPASIITLVRLGATQLPGPIEIIVKIAIALFSALLGNQLYLKSASKHIEKIAADNKDMDNRALLKAIKAEGGTTNAPIIVFIVLVIAMILALTLGLAYLANMMMGVGGI